MNTKQSDEVEKEIHQDMFDYLGRFAMNHAGQGMPESIIEAIDYLANYCGDIAKGREVTLEKPEDAFPSLFASLRSQEAKRVEELQVYVDHLFSFHSCNCDLQDLTDKEV